MPPKPHLRSPPPPVSAVECHSPFDNAWYNVSVSSAGRKGKIRIRYDGFPDCYDEQFKVSDFAGPAELNRFLDRFRPASLQLQDGWCREGLVAAGDVVCACRQSGDADVLFYDAVVDSVCYSEHQFLEGEEICTCTFVVSWQHGPNVGLKTTIRVENLCLLQHGDPTIDATLRSFVKAWKEKFDLDMERSTRLGSKKLMFEGMNCNGKQNIEQDVDLGGGFSHHKDYYYPMSDHYIILVENLEKDIFPWTIRDFIYQHTSILSRVYVVPGLVWETYVRGVIFLDSEEKLEKLFCFLCNPTHLIVSSRGRPWVIREKKWSFSLVGCVIPKNEDFIFMHISIYPFPIDPLKGKPWIKDQELCEKIQIVHQGSEQYERSRRLCELFIEFQEHVQGLYETLASKETQLIRSLHVVQ